MTGYPRSVKPMEMAPHDGLQHEASRELSKQLSATGLPVVEALPGRANGNRVARPGVPKQWP